MDRRVFVKLAACSAVAASDTGSPAFARTDSASSAFVTRASDGTLRLNGQLFRYIGANMPEVTHIRTDWDLEQGNRFRLPTTDEIDWMVETAAQANFKVIRTWCFPSHLQPEVPESLHYLRRNPDGLTVTLNETGFELFDYFLLRCRQLGVRAQVPFVYLYQPQEWADLAGNPHPQLLDFITKVTARVNTRTGIAYRDDPFIYAWESGNEARPSARWVAALASFTKGVAPRQLFIDGRWGATDVYNSYVQPALASNRDIDIVSFHTYERRPKGWSMPEAITRLAALMRAQGRALGVGEIGPATTPAELADILSAVVSQPVAGASWWSFKGARAKGGYTQWNGQRYGGNDDLKWPGFVAQLDGLATEKAKVDLLCGAAYALDARQRPDRLPPPTPAKLLPIRDTGHISWIPGTGEQVAEIQRSTLPDRGFVTIAGEFETIRGANHDLFCDASALPGETYFYRVGSRNSGGAADWSNVVGPVQSSTGWMVDDFWTFDRTLSRSDDMYIESHYDLVAYHCDLSVLKAVRDQQHLIYQLRGRLVSLFLLSNNDTQTVKLDVGTDGAEFRELPTVRKFYPPLHAEFAGHPRIGHRAVLSAEQGLRYLRVRFGAADVLSRLEVEFSPA